MSRAFNRVAIVGGGVGGSTLAFHLARTGMPVAIFDPERRPSLVVGESMIPAIIPFLRELGIEDEVAGYSVYKPGATFLLNENDKICVRFDEVRAAKTTHAYNIPRDKLDASVLQSALRAGAGHVKSTAKLERVDGTDRVVLAPESNAAAAEMLGGPPDLIVDASGRARVLSKLLGIPAQEGTRKDSVLFAHCEEIGLVNPGDIHVDLLERGWSWRIPLPGRTSVGLVIDSGHIKKFGDDLDAQFDGYVAQDPMIQRWEPAPRRLTRVVRYTNYQLVSDRGVGDGWALVGDTFGFVDPVFSSGTLLAFHGGRDLAGEILSGSGRPGLERYAARTNRHIRAWQQTVDHFYNGRILTLFQVGERVRQQFWGRIMDIHLSKHLPRVFTGEGSAQWYSPALVNFMCERALYDNDPDLLRIG